MKDEHSGFGHSTLEVLWGIYAKISIRQSDKLVEGQGGVLYRDIDLKVIYTKRKRRLTKNQVNTSN